MAGNIEPGRSFVSGGRQACGFRAWRGLLMALACAGGLAAQVVRVEASGRDARRGIEVNREPIVEIAVSARLFEVTADGFEDLGVSAGLTRMRPGSREVATFSFEEERGSLRLTVELLQLGRESTTLRLMLAESPGRRLVDETVAVDDRQEVFVEFAESVSGRSRLALRLVPRIAVIDPVLDYPGIVPRFGITGGILIQRSDEILARGSVVSTNPRRSQDVLQVLVFTQPSVGRFLCAYRPFPGGTAAGYVEDRRLVFEWDGVVYEWISVEAPILTDGKWTLYVQRQLASRGETGASIAAWDLPRRLWPRVLQAQTSEKR